MVRMKKVHQRRVEKGKGDCMQSAIASLFDLPYELVPDFISYHKQGSGELMENANYLVELFYKSKGYDYGVVSGDTSKMIEAAKHDGGIDGYFYASVPSQTLGKGITHAVIVDSNLNIVHDPNPNEKCLNLKPKDVLSIVVVTDWYFDENGKIVDNSR